ncbi:hypothetical protein D3C86_1402790 [compost metagenome]
MRLGGADDGDDDGRAGEARALRFLLLQVQFRVIFKRDPERRFTETHTLLAAINHETPRRELAMVRHAHGKAQDVLDLPLRRSRLGKLQGRRRAASLEIIEELDITCHDQKSSILLSSRNMGLEIAMALVLK